MSEEDTANRLVETDTPKLPEKYQGKSAAEIAAMHAELEKRLGAQSQEVGDTRARLAQLEAQLMQQAENSKEPFDERLFADPAAAVGDFVDERLAPLKQQNALLQQQAFQRELDAHRSDWRDVVNDAGFAQFVQGSPLAARLYQEAEERLDLSSAKALLEAWDLQNNESSAVKDAVTTDRKKRAAVTEKGSPNRNPGKEFTRSEIQELREKNPELYEQRLPAIMQAYKDRRVKDG